jgi:hypothetical protein
MTDAEKIAELQEAVSRLEAAVGMQYAVRAPTPEDIGPQSELPSGRYPLLLSDYQLRLQGIAPMQADIEALKAEDPVPLPPPNVEVPTDLIAQLEAMGVEFSRDLISGIKYTEFDNPEGTMYGYSGVDDAGLRQFNGIRKKIGTDVWSAETIDVNRNLPVIMGPVVERDGAVSWDWNPPINGDDPNPYPNKTFLMYLAGFVRGSGPRKTVGPYMDFGSFEAGRGIRWFVRRPGSQSPDTEVIIQMDAQGLAIRVGDGLRRITMAGDGSLRAGDPIIEDQ